jgi:hypothetical protein
MRCGCISFYRISLTFKRLPGVQAASESVLGLAIHRGAHRDASMRGQGWRAMSFAVADDRRPEARSHGASVAPDRLISKLLEVTWCAGFHQDGDLILGRHCLRRSGEGVWVSWRSGLDV